MVCCIVRTGGFLFGWVGEREQKAVWRLAMVCGARMSVGCFFCVWRGFVGRWLGIGSVLWAFGICEASAEGKRTGDRYKGVWDIYQTQIFLQANGQWMKGGKMSLVQPFGEEVRVYLGHTPEAIQRMDRGKWWLGFLVGSLSVSLLSVGGAFTLLFTAPGVLGGTAVDNVVFSLLGVGLIAFPAALLMTIPLGQTVHGAVESANHAAFERLQTSGAWTSTQQMAWLLLQSKRISSHEDGWIRKGKQRLPALSAWHEVLMKEEPEHLASLRQAWGMRVAGIAMLSAGGLAMLGGLAFFAINPYAVFGIGPVLIPPGLSYGLWAGGFLAFGVGVLLEISAQHTYQRTLAAYNHAVFQRVAGPRAKRKASVDRANKEPMDGVAQTNHPNEEHAGSRCIEACRAERLLSLD